MLQRLIARTASLCLSALMTLAILGSIDHLAQPADHGGAQWAQATRHQA